MKLDKLKEALRGGPEEAPEIWLSSGSTLLNLASTNHPFRCLRAGGFYSFVGDSASGKTVVAGTCLAEAAMSKRFKEYSLIFDNVEDGALMFRPFFGERIADRIRTPLDKGESSGTVEDYYDNKRRIMEDGPTVYVLDSENALTSEAEVKKQKKTAAARAKAEESSGTMTDAKAKYHSQNLRGSVADVRDTKSIDIMISQSRQAMGFGAQFEPDTRAGGKAITFYAQLVFWFKRYKAITKLVRDKPREIGMYAQVKVKKNRFTGKSRSVIIPIYHSFGVDDLGSCIDYLVKEGHWTKKTGGIIHATELDQGLRQSDLIKWIEENNQERELRIVTGRVWNEIEKECEVVRKPRYV